jgi:hypothetical protein
MEKLNIPFFVSAADWAFIFANRGTVRKKTNRRGVPPKKTAWQRPTACKLTSDCRTTSKFL